MEHFANTPMLRHARRQSAATAKPGARTGDGDCRWHLLDLARVCRQRLKLRDRDIAVLRGLLSLLPANATAQQTVVFASNRVLTERCDGIDERTLRRRIAHLESSGLVARHTSPNGKRYQVRDERAIACLTYGIDLAPLFRLQPHLETLADDCRKDALRIKALRSLIRDALFHHPAPEGCALHKEAQLALRRVLGSDALQQLLTRLAEKTVAPSPLPHIGETAEMTASYGQNDRHIQSSNKEAIESEKMQMIKTTKIKTADITVTECIDLAQTAKAMAASPPQSWEDLIGLSATLAPAIGLKQAVIHAANAQLGRHGCALAVLGLIEAYHRIRNPEAYLTALMRRAAAQGIDLVRMFRSLVKPARAGAGLVTCLPG